MLKGLKRIYWLHFLQGCYFHAPIVSLFLTSNSIGVGALFFSQVFYAVGTLLFEVPSGVFADKHGHEKSIRIGYFIDAICLALLVVYPTVHMLYILYFCRGAAGAFISGSLETVLYNVDQKKYTANLSTATQLMNAGDVSAVLLASLLFGLFGDASFEVLILMTVFAQFCNFLLTFGILPARSVDQVESGVHELQILKTSFDLLKSNLTARKLLIWSLLVISGTQMLELSAPLIMRDVGVLDFMIPAVFVLSSMLSIVFLRLFVRMQNMDFRLINIIRSTLFAGCGIVFVTASSAILAYAAFLIMFALRDVLKPLYYKRISDLASDMNRATVLSMFSMYKYVGLILLRILAGTLGSAVGTVLLLSIYILIGVIVFIYDFRSSRS